MRQECMGLAWTLYISFSSGSRYGDDGLTSTDARFALRVGTGTEALLSLSGKALRMKCHKYRKLMPF